MAKFNIFDSLSELKLKALDNNIEFYNGISECTLSKLSLETKEFLVKHGSLVASDGTYLSNIKILNNYAVDMISSLGEARAGNVLLGQNLTTKKFLAFKPMDKFETTHTNHITELLDSRGFQGIITHPENQDLILFGVDLIDGVTFKNIKQIADKINEAARYLMAYNLVQEFKYFVTHHVIQQDKNFGNFIIDVRDFSIKIIDYGRCEDSNDDDPFIKIAGLIDCIFANNAPIDEQYHGYMTKYTNSIFQGFLEKISESNEYDGEFFSNIIGSLPFSDEI